MKKTVFHIPDDVFNADNFLSALKCSKSRISLFKKTIERTTDYLHQHFQQGDNIRELVRARASFIDQLLQSAWQLFQWDEDISLSAVGGYGRGELHPHSDIDILILLKGETCFDKYQTQISDFITLLWDISLDIGHSVRTCDECFNEAAKDITIATNLMESRTIIGNEQLLEQTNQRVESDSWASKDFFRAKWDEQIERHSKHGNSEYNLEPNIKSSPGGLRDVQMIGWIAKRHFGAISLEELVERGFLLADELKELNKGIEFLWHVRYCLHMITGRKEDRLLFDHQRTMAKMFGFEDDDARLAVERFMQQYYRWALTLGNLNDLLMQLFDETILRACEAETVLEINPRFRVCNGHIEVANDKVFEKNPSALLEVFVLMATSPNIDGVRASTIRLIRENGHLIDEAFRNDPRNTRYFMEILRAPEKVALQLRRMLRFGILGRYLPEFQAIIGQMQHDLFHIYSVDAHTMEVVKNLRRFHYPKFQKKFPIVAQVALRLDRHDLLYIAGLYHDIAKGRGGDHSELGELDAAAFCKRHQLTKSETNLVCWLVRNHLLMSAVAQRKDISDPAVINDFAKIVGTQNRLDNLFALTVADINATNPTLWNSWRASLLRQLYNETKRALRRGLANPADKQDWIDDTQNVALGRLEALGLEASDIRAVWAEIGEDYFLREKVEDVIWHTAAIAQHANKGTPLILLKESGEIAYEGATQIFVHTSQKDSLFALLAAALEQLDLTIHDARIYSSGNQFTLDTFFVLDANGEAIGDNPERIEEIKVFLSEQIQSDEEYVDIISRRTPRQMRLFSIPTTTIMSTDPARGLNVLEVMTPDRPGLLARIGKIFLDFEVELQNAKIATLGERVEDVFFITNKDQKPIEDPAICEAIQKAIRDELDEQASS